MKPITLTPEQVWTLLPALLRDVPTSVLAALVEDVRAGNVTATVRLIPKRTRKRKARK